VLNILFLLLGIALLTVGGEALIRGSLTAAKRLGVSPLLSGLVIVGFGTSTPELVVSVNAPVEGHQTSLLATLLAAIFSICWGFQGCPLYFSHFRFTQEFCSLING
jgi:Ca2+/Na+ antiporter